MISSAPDIADVTGSDGEPIHFSLAVPSTITKVFSIALLPAISADFERMRRVTDAHLHPFESLCTTDTSVLLMRSYVPGVNLTDFVRSNQRLDPSESLRLCQQILTAVKLLHRNGLTLKTLRPSNVIVSDDLSIVLVDYGIEQVFLRKMLKNPAPSDFVYLGYRYLRFSETDPFVMDAWAVIVIFYFLITGTEPFATRHVMNLLKLMEGGAAIPEWLDGSLAEFLRKIMDVRETFTLDELAAMLDTEAGKVKGTVNRRKLAFAKRAMMATSMGACLPCKPVMMTRTIERGRHSVSSHYTGDVCAVCRPVRIRQRPRIPVASVVSLAGRGIDH